MRRAVLLLACLCLPAPTLGAQGWIVPRPCVVGMRPADMRPLPPIRDCRPDIVRTRSDVRVQLTDRVLHYEVDERFVNRGAMIGEADYLFPLPANAAFEKLELSVNGELVAGETMNADQARGIYESIVRARRDPALVEWMGHGLLRARIFPLNPGEEKRVVVRFQSVAPREGDALRVDYSRGAGDNMPGMADDGPSSFTLSYRPSSEYGTPYSPTHTLDTSDQGGMRQVSVRGDARDLTLLVPVRRSNTASISMLPYAPGNDDGFALVTITPPPVPRGETTPRDITLVLDVSGSMQGRKMEQARAAGRQLLGTLRPADRFRLIDFSSDVRTFKDDFVPATSDNVRDAMRYLDALEAQGGTNIEAALREAIRPPTINGRLPLILFVTDGEPTIGDANADHLAAIASDASEHGGVHRRIFTFGLGSDVNVSLLEQLAMDGRGTAQFVRPDESVERMVGIVANRLVDPVLTDVRVRVDGNVTLSKMLPMQPIDLFADRDLVVLARYGGRGPAHIVVDGMRRGTPVQWTSTADFPDRERANPFVARLWAAQRVGFLSAERRKNGGSKEVDDEIKMLGERYGIPTEFTSYLVTEPQVAAQAVPHGMVMPAMAPAAAPAADSRKVAFEAARRASAQLSLQSVVAIDSMSRAAGRDVGGASTRHANGRTFVLRDSVWTDVSYRSGLPIVTIKPYSRAYFDVLAKLPDLRAVFALGDRVIVVGRRQAIGLSDRGVSTLTDRALADLVATW